ncbi:Uncharacterised protein [Salmonella enterica subsp. enterica serovar Bovismorbificans]|uniref:Uncharacterized protein n=1 Tax=Salmonella enterica subsp. enterica serovar Bovismorbificans TaxID=58097 RepID=A0A655BLJ0_SALET|nr:Uncharacterised protein [Salmonella enterica subsp. enterica serovar Bovismorbificans]
MILALVSAMPKGSPSMPLKNIEVSCAPKSSMKKTITAGVNRRARRCPKPLMPINIVTIAEIAIPTDRLEAISFSGVPRDASPSVIVRIAPHHSPVGPSIMARRWPQNA